MIGEVLHVSPVMAVIVAGLAIGTQRARITTAQTRLQLHSVYQTLIFLLESVVFSLIGLQLPPLIRDLSRAGAWPAEALAITGHPDRGADRVGLPAVGGHPAAHRRPAPVVARACRGVLGGHPRGGAAGRGLVHPPDRGQRQRRCHNVTFILVLAAAVIVVSLIVQGLTLEPLARFAGITRQAAARHEETTARVRLAEAALARLDGLADAEAAPDAVINRVRASLPGAHRAASAQTPPALPERAASPSESCAATLSPPKRRTRPGCMTEGAINAGIRRRLQHGLDLDAARLSDEQR